MITPIEREEQKGHSTKTQTMRGGELKEYAKMQEVLKQSHTQQPNIAVTASNISTDLHL